MQTAMQKLIEELLYHLAYDDDLTDESRDTLEKVVDKCKGKLEMEKEQIIDTHYQGYRNFIDTTEISEKYYNETYGK